MVQQKSRSPSSSKSASEHVPETCWRRGQDVTLGQKMVYSIHPHPLIRHHDGSSVVYRCSGCQEQGFGCSYRCENNNCNSNNNNGQSFVIHEACAYAGANSNSRFRHRFLGDNEDLQFLKKPPGNIRLCEACRKEVRGFAYHRDDTTGHVGDTGSDLHPCCFQLNDDIILYKNNPSLRMTLKLNSAIPRKCLRCNKQKVKDSNDSKVKGWSYVSSDGKYCYHVACLRELVIDQWKQGLIDQDIMVKRTELDATGDEDDPNPRITDLVVDEEVDPKPGITKLVKMVSMVVLFLVFFFLFWQDKISSTLWSVFLLFFIGLPYGWWVFLRFFIGLLYGVFGLGFFFGVVIGLGFSICLLGESQIQHAI